MKKKLKPYSTYFGDGAAQSQMNTITVTSDCLPSPHQTTPPMQSDVGEHAHKLVQLSHPPTLTTLNFCLDLVGKSMSYHMHLLPQPQSPRCVDLSDCTVLCSSILESTLVVSEGQAIDGVDVAQPTCIVIYNKYDCGSKHEPVVKDDLLLSAPPPHFLDIFGDYAISNFPCVNSSTNASTFDHSQNTLDVSLSFDNEEEKSFIENPLDFSSTFSGNTEGEHSCFSLTPLHDSSNHEDANEHAKCDDHGFHGIYTSSFDHDIYSLTLNLSKPLVSNDLSIEEVETP